MDTAPRVGQAGPQISAPQLPETQVSGNAYSTLECILHKDRDFSLVHSESPSTRYSAEHVVGTNKYFLIKYWAGQKVRPGLDSGLQVRCYGKTQKNFWANPIKKRVAWSKSLTLS